MKRRFGILTLGLGLAVFLGAALRGTTATSFRQGEDEKVLKKGEYRNPVADLVNVKVKGVSVAFGRKISGGDEWLKGLTVSVKNTSSKPIVYIEVEVLLFNEKGDKETTGKVPFIYPLFYGNYHSTDPSQPPPPNAPYRELAPGDTVDIALTDEAYESLIGMLSEAAYPLPPRHAELSVADVIFADDSRWYKSMLLRRDPNNPKEWLRVRKREQGPIGNKRTSPNTAIPCGAAASPQ